MTAKPACSIEGCLDPVKARGWCKRHYLSWYKHGQTEYERVTHVQKAELFRADPTDVRHGTANGYSNLDCRCARCRAAWNVAFRAYLDSHPEQREKARLRARVYRETIKETG